MKKLILELPLEATIQMAKDLGKDGINSKAAAKDMLVQQLSEQHCLIHLRKLTKCPIQDFENADAQACKECWEKFLR
jgi:hypothetical protein